jgi:cytosine/adenosine deaminase-related metal-dependent hydrolase
MPEPHTYTARWVFPVAGPPLPNGTVTVRGEKIEAVEPRGARTPDVDLGNAAVIPGLVNAHTHLDLSGARGLIPPTDPDHFTDWLRGVIAYRHGRTPEQVQADIRAGLAECLRSGTTLLGDITAGGASWNAVSAAAVRGVVFREVIGLAYDADHDPVRTLAGWGDWRDTFRTPLTRRGASPHAPYSVSAEVIRGIDRMKWPLTIHLAEAPGERDLLERRAGPFVEFLTALGVWRPDRLAGCWADILRQLRSSLVVLAHANYLAPDANLFPNQAVVYCPRTHAAFGHPRHPFRGFLAWGTRVALGTDSLASNPDLDILAEARFVHAKYPDFPGDALLRMVTLSGAEALGWADEAGSLEPGKSADFVVVPLPDRDAADPHELLLADHPGSRHTMFRGTWRS